MSEGMGSWKDWFFYLCSEALKARGWWKPLDLLHCQIFKYLLPALHFGFWVNRHGSRKEVNSLSTILVFLCGRWTWQMFVSCFFFQGFFISKENFQGILQGFFISKETLTYNFIPGVLMEKRYIPMQGHRSQRLVSGVFLYHVHHIFWDRVSSWAWSSAVGQLQLLLSPSPVPETTAMHHCPFRWCGCWVAGCSRPNLHRKQLTHWPPHQPILRRSVCCSGLQTTTKNIHTFFALTATRN